MKQYIIFGAGMYGRQALDMIGKENIKCFFDNDFKKVDTFIDGIPIYSLENKIELCKRLKVIIAVSKRYQNEIVEQLKNFGIVNYRLFSEIKKESALRKLSFPINNIEIYNKAINWVKSNTVKGQGIICSSANKKAYPEVTGYFIPTLIKWGYRDLAKSYAQWLCSIQKEDGSWYDCDNYAPYVFDTAQILKGLIAIRDIYPAVDDSIMRACEWIISNVKENGHLVTPVKEAWGTDENTCSELIHLYCLTPLIEVSNIFGNDKYKNVANKVLNYYKTNYYEKISNFSLLSHFYAYVMEGLLDLGEKDIVTDAMANLENILNEKKMVPAYNNVNWVCSTGLFQLALVWFKLGNISAGNKIFNYACKLQNDSGGWFGSYLTECSENEDNTYFPSGEISWAVKYFLDALYYKNVAEFEAKSDTFLDEISSDDGKYKLIEKVICERKNANENLLKILDAGCGKGGYIAKLQANYPNNNFYAIDISEKIMEKINNGNIEKHVGCLTNIPFDDSSFDIVFAVEVLEHSVDIKNSIKELARVTKNGGEIIIICKNEKALGKLETDEWEQCFSLDELTSELRNYCENIKSYNFVSYDFTRNDELFIAIEGIVI